MKMIIVQIVIVIIVIDVGAFEVDVSNWSPFAPNGVQAIITGATVVFFAYVGFDAVVNSAEEAKKPQRDLPIGILGSLLICAILYIGVCLVITGMVPYKFLGEDAHLAEAFKSKGLKCVSILISIGVVDSLTTTLLVGLYVQVVTVISWSRTRWLTTFNICKGILHASYSNPFPGPGWNSYWSLGRALQCSCTLAHSVSWFIGIPEKIMWLSKCCFVEYVALISNTLRTNKESNGEVLSTQLSLGGDINCNQSSTW